MREVTPKFKMNLLKYGKILTISGILLALYCIIGSVRLFLLFDDLLTVAIVLFSLLILCAVLLHIGSVCTNFYRVTKGLSKSFIVEDVDFIRSILTVRDRARVYTITYEEPETIGQVGYYKVLTPLTRLPKSGPHPFFAEVTKKDGMIMLLSRPSKKIASSYMNERLTSLAKVARNIDAWGTWKGN
jgi:hypothetical protein